MQKYITTKHVKAGIVDKVIDGVITTECGFMLPIENLGNRSSGEPPKGSYLVDYQNNDYFGWCPADIFLESSEKWGGAFQQWWMENGSTDYEEMVYASNAWDHQQIAIDKLSNTGK